MDVITDLKVDVKMLSISFAWIIRDALSVLYIQNRFPIPSNMSSMMLPAE